jgi:ATP-dependent DNA ligase
VPDDFAPPIEPMLAAAVPTIDDVAVHDVSWEPKFDGYRCLVWRDGDDLTLWSRSRKRLDRYFPELPGRLKATLPGRCVLDGELVVPLDGHLDFDALSQRIHPAASRIAKLAEATPAHLVVFDLLALGDRVLLDTAWAERRGVLEQVVGAPKAPLHLCPSSRDVIDATRWLDDIGSGDIDGVVAKPIDGRYLPGVRGWFKVKPHASIDAVVAGYRMHQDGAGVGSLLLGLYDDTGVLHYIGASTAFGANDRAAIGELLEPLAIRDDGTHPWLGDPVGRVPGTPSRWSGSRDTAWVPVRPELVVEIAAERFASHRLRHNAKVVRWRTDRDAASCSFDQIPSRAPVQPVWGAV